MMMMKISSHVMWRETYMALERRFANYVFNKYEHCFINSQFRKFFKFSFCLMPLHELSLAFSLFTLLS
jgi:hypothetical protein